MKDAGIEPTTVAEFNLKATSHLDHIPPTGGYISSTLGYNPSTKIYKRHLSQNVFRTVAIAGDVFRPATHKQDE
jgi:hypothetical protein